MNNRGFTLIELIITIGLLAIISTISVSVIGDIRETHKKNLYNELIENIKSASKLYVANNRYNLDISCTNSNFMEVSVSLNTLVNEGYLSSDNGVIKNPKDGKEIELDKEDVKITFDCDNKSFSYVIELENN